MLGGKRTLPQAARIRSSKAAGEMKESLEKLFLVNLDLNSNLHAFMQN